MHGYFWGEGTAHERSPAAFMLETCTAHALQLVCGSNRCSSRGSHSRSRSRRSRCSNINNTIGTLCTPEQQQLQFYQDHCLRLCAPAAAAAASIAARASSSGVCMPGGGGAGPPLAAMASHACAARQAHPQAHLSTCMCHQVGVAAQA